MMNWRRFLLQLFLWLPPMFVFWWWTRELAAKLSIEACKMLHLLVSRPAPYLIPDVYRETWHSPMVAPFLALILASCWLGWRQRILRAVTGYLVLLLLTAASLALIYSPYVPISKPWWLYVAMPVTKSQFTLWPIVVWLLAAGWPTQRVADEPADRSSNRKRSPSREWVKLLWVPRAFAPAFGLILLTMILSLASPDTRHAGAAMARAVKAGGTVRAFNAEWESIALNPGARSCYLIGRMLQRNGRVDVARRYLYRTFERWNKPLYHQEFGREVPEGTRPLRRPGWTPPATH